MTDLSIDSVIRAIVREELARRQVSQTSAKVLDGMVLAVNPGNTIDVSTPAQIYRSVGIGRPVSVGENVVVVVSGNSVGAL